MSQVDTSHLTIIDDPNIEDGHHTIWDMDEVVKTVEQEVDRHAIDTVRVAASEL